MTNMRQKMRSIVHRSAHVIILYDCQIRFILQSTGMGRCVPRFIYLYIVLVIKVNMYLKT